MDDEQLRHLCRLASVSVMAIRDPDYDAGLLELRPRTVRDTVTCHRILADAFVELARRQGMLPSFRVPAEQQLSPIHERETV